MEEKSSPDVRIAHLAARAPRDLSGRRAAVPDVEVHSPVAGHDLAPDDDVLPVRRPERLSSPLAAYHVGAVVVRDVAAKDDAVARHAMVDDPLARREAP